MIANRYDQIQKQRLKLTTFTRIKLVRLSTHPIDADYDVTPSRQPAG